MKSLSRPAMVLAALIATPFQTASAADDKAGKDGRQIAINIFQTIDERRKAGSLNSQDLAEFGETVLVSMDADNNGSVSRAEFLEWDPGFGNVAKKVGRFDGFITAQKIMFAMWDTSGNDIITKKEMNTAMSRDLRRADLDDNGSLNQNEFIAGFSIIVAMRAAIRPDL